MNRKVFEAAAGFVERACAVGQRGRCEDFQAMVSLNRDMQERLPDWFVELCVNVPLSGLELSWTAGELEGTLEWADAKGIRSESLECYPGIAILERGYINVGSDLVGSGDSFFIPTGEGQDPPVYQVYHDVSDQADEILEEGRLEVSPSLSSLFQAATGE